MSPPAPLTVTLAGLAAAELVRAEYPDCIHDADDGRSRTVTLSGDTPSYCLDAIGQIARRSFDERDERYGQVELTPGERARVDFSETNVFHARACKAIAEHHGVLVGGVERGGPAAKAGLKRGDIVLSFAGTRVHRVQELMFAVAETAPGEEAEVTVLRGDDEKTLTVELTNRPDASGPPRRSKKPKQGATLGVEVSPLPPQLAHQLGTEAGEGVFVKRVLAGTPAADVLKKGDVILQLGESAVADPNELKEALDDHESGEVVRMRVLRGGDGMFLAVRLR